MTVATGSEEAPVPQNVKHARGDCAGQQNAEAKCSEHEAGA